MRTLQSFSFNAGQTMRISFDLSGNQRGGADDQWSLGLFFGGLPSGTVAGSGAFTGTTGGPFFNVASVTFFRAIAPGTPYATYTMDFLATAGGSVQYEIGTASADNVGPVLDNVVIERLGGGTVVPEPSTWAMLAFGMSAVGVASRRRRKA
ncbi:MAG: PEPxxWA-CTERM sorting domain-containing protein [Phycisphaerae bacterium]|nr:PEPxxWA-CTERM sorting domain-containing protein [Gemmatimonadaceae bacterium]